MKNLRQTYITWVKTVLGDKTGKVTSHSDFKVLEDYNIDPTIISAIENNALTPLLFLTKILLNSVKFS